MINILSMKLVINKDDILFLRGGFFTFGMYPIGIELSQEATYPLDPAAPVALIYFFGLLTTTLFILLSGLLEQPLPEDAPETCSIEDSSIEAKDHTNFLLFMMGLNGISSVLYTFGFKADYRRRRANQPNTSVTSP